MNEMEFKEKFEQLASDEQFVAQLRGLKDRTAIQNHFAENGLELPEDMLDGIMSKIAYFEENGELDEETLMVVSGGGMGGAFGWGAAGAAFGAKAGWRGAVAGFVVGFVAYWVVGG